MNLTSIHRHVYSERKANDAFEAHKHKMYSLEVKQRGDGVAFKVKGLKVHIRCTKRLLIKKGGSA